jgi:hypothetical protein
VRGDAGGTKILQTVRNLAPIVCAVLICIHATRGGEEEYKPNVQLLN